MNKALADCSSSSGAEKNLRLYSPQMANVAEEHTERSPAEADGKIESFDLLKDLKNFSHHRVH